MQNPIICPNCEGDGERENRKGETVECVSCKGEGVLKLKSYPMPNLPKFPLHPIKIAPYTPPQLPGYDIWCSIEAKL